MLKISVFPVRILKSQVLQYEYVNSSFTKIYTKAQIVCLSVYLKLLGYVFYFILLVHPTIHHISKITM